MKQADRVEDEREVMSAMLMTDSAQNKTTEVSSK